VKLAPIAWACEACSKMVDITWASNLCPYCNHVNLGEKEPYQEKQLTKAWPQPPRKPRHVRRTAQGARFASLDELANWLTTKPSLYWRGRPQPSAFVIHLSLYQVIRGLESGHFHRTAENRT